MLALLGALGYRLWYARQETRPGMNRYIAGLERLRAGNADAAEDAWLRCAREDPGFAPCHEALGDLYAQLRRLGEAAAHYNEAARQTPRDGTLFLRLLRVEKRRGRGREAAAAGKRAVALRPEDADAWGEYGILLAQQGKPAPALAALQRAHALRPSDRRYLLGMASLKLDNGDIAGAERDLQPYLQKHPDDGRACLLMAVAYSSKPRTPDNRRAALDHARRARAALKNDVRAVTVLGDLYLDANRPADALRTFAAGERLAPRSEAVLQGLMRCYARLGDARGQARMAARLQKVAARHARIEYLRDALRFGRSGSPPDVEAMLELARLTEEDGDPGAARVHLEAFVRESPGDARLRRALAALYRRGGQPDLAQRAMLPDFIP